ncbi:hypothetical protein M23134_01372 [Microscilla marina ATCC 23134]|uniref:Uncharacterized protein n=1 Tax=Microscilla marina ATCC 23134 TaxID=313606 RepID=A1ZJL5_MICM2|nr:hypothetical protein M23134_01372 [Microscilla marina ATCC 23134]
MFKKILCVSFKSFFDFYRNNCFEHLYNISEMLKINNTQNFVYFKDYLKGEVVRL